MSNTHAQTGRFDSAIERAIERSAAAEGFTSQVHTVEISGLCPHCRGTAEAGEH